MGVSSKRRERKTMKELGLSVSQTAMIVFFVQIIFLYLRTINVRAVAHDKMFAAIASGVGIGLSWMIGTAIGVSSVLAGEPLPIFMHILGGSIGTYYGMKYDKKKRLTHNDRLHKRYPDAIYGDTHYYEEIMDFVELDKNNNWVRKHV